jgi:hypothetical protein
MGLKMAKFFGNLQLVFIAGLVLTLVVAYLGPALAG